MFLNYANLGMSVETLKLVMRDPEFILLDNADLYMTDELWDYIKSLNCCCHISLKKVRNYSLSNVTICTVSYLDDKIRLKKLV